MAKKKGFIELRLHHSIPELILMQEITLREYKKMSRGKRGVGMNFQEDVLEVLRKISELEIFEINAN